MEDQLQRRCQTRVAFFLNRTDASDRHFVQCRLILFSSDKLSLKETCYLKDDPANTFGV